MKNIEREVEKWLLYITLIHIMKLRSKEKN